ncbi:putative mitogen-activated protein kinase kinase kinase 7-like [Drosophila subobscura]|uniref:putative mitogen-activated protein kinase kinase kinase 7-like n=1 Tax=Drosophila subobscura TaxID=7241 RepID=UPI00155ADFD1|nr:putative mitogen-activated protein kinase kinase kinase 7-like [Drosophila subobscura]
MATKFDFSELQISQRLGCGGFGAVYRGRWRSQKIAVKKFYERIEESIEREITQLARVAHENIVKLFGMATFKDETYLLMEYVEGGSLHDFLYGAVRREYTVQEATNWALQCAEAVAYLHAMTPRPMLHRDIKPHNMLLTGIPGRLKICDFGTVTDMHSSMSNARGTPAYMAPEVIMGRKYTDKCDVYSWGVMLWELMSRRPPFSHMENPNQVAVMLAAGLGDRPDMDAVRADCPEAIKQLIRRCWSKEPLERCSMQQVVKFLNDMGVSSDYKDFVYILDQDTVAVVTVRQEGHGSSRRRVVHISFWRKRFASARLSLPIAEREAERVARQTERETIRAARNVSRETVRAAQDTGRETARAAEDAGHEIARAAHDAERETRRAERDAERETRRLKEDAEREARRLKEDAEREARRLKENAEREARRLKENAEREAKLALEKAAQEARRVKENAEREARQAKEKIAAEAKRLADRGKKVLKKFRKF